MAVESSFSIGPPPGLERPWEGAAAAAAAPGGGGGGRGAPRRCFLQLDGLLLEAAGPAVGALAPAGGAQPPAGALGGGSNALWGSGALLLSPGGFGGSRPLAIDQPACVRLGGCPSPDSTSAGEALSDRSLPSSGDCGVLGNAWLLSQDPAGSRRVQDALDKASDETREALLKEFHGRAVKAMRDPHANHVLQKCISIMAPELLQFMVDELLEREGLATAVARHRYGGRIVQQLLKRCSAAQVGGLAEALMQEMVTLACHSFGHFSMQHLLQIGTEAQRQRLARGIASSVETICRSKVGDGVVAVAMEHASSEDQLSIARAVLLEPGLLVELAKGRHGHSAVLRMLQVLDGQGSVQAYVSLAGEIASLRASRYGRAVAKHLEEEALHLAVGSGGAPDVTRQASPPRASER